LIAAVSVSPLPPRRAGYAFATISHTPVQPLAAPLFAVADTIDAAVEGFALLPPLSPLPRELKTAASPRPFTLRPPRRMNSLYRFLRRHAEFQPPPPHLPRRILPVIIFVTAC